jgi:mannose-1-phosphate guanylyltransferase
MTTPTELRIVVLSGGAGTRFWPVSRRRRPKQLVRLGGAGSLLRGTLERVRQLSPPSAWWLVAGRDHAEACRAEVPEVPAGQVLVEPVGRNTAAAIGLAAVHLVRRDIDAVMAILPADHSVARPEELCRALSLAREVALATPVIVTLGVKPDRPETAYGYIEAGAALPGRAGAFQVERFREKPDLETAKALLDRGGHSWNAGIFVMRARAYLDEVARHLPEVASRLQRIAGAIGTDRYDATLAEAYDTMPNVSIDYGVMEKAREVAVVPVDCGWSDVGSWNALGAVAAADARGNVALGRAILLDTRDAVVYAEEGQVVAVIGLQGVVVVHTPDATLVVPADRAQEVRRVVAELTEKKWSEYL